MKKEYEEYKEKENNILTKYICEIYEFVFF